MGKEKNNVTPGWKGGEGGETLLNLEFNKQLSFSKINKLNFDFKMIFTLIFSIFFDIFLKGNFWVGSIYESDLTEEEKEALVEYKYGRAATQSPC